MGDIFEGLAAKHAARLGEYEAAREAIGMPSDAPLQGISPYIVGTPEVAQEDAMVQAYQQDVPQQQQEPQLPQPSQMQPIVPPRMMNIGGTSQWGKTTQETAPLGPLPAAVTAQRDRGFEAITAANRAGAEAESAAAQGSAAATEALRQDQIAGQARLKQEKAKIIARSQEQDQDRKAARDRHRQMKVDPGRRFSGGAGVASKIGFAIAAAAQGFIMGYRGQAGPNPILQMMEREIEQDIALQQDEIDKAKGEIGDLDTIYKETLAEGKTAEEAAHQQRMYGYEDLKLKVEGLGQQAKSEVLRQRAEAGAGEIDVRLSKLAADDYRAGQGRTVTSTQKGGSSRRGLVGGKADAAKVAKLPDDVRKDFTKGLQILRGSDVISAKLGAGGYGVVNRHWPTHKHKRIREVLVKPLLTKLGVMNAGGVLSDTEYDRSKGMLDSVLTTPEDLQKTLGLIQSNVAADMAVQLQATQSAAGGVPAAAALLDRYTKGRPIPGLK